MNFSREYLLATLSALEQQAPPARRFVIALSGGLDSSVLADALCASRETHGKALLAVHVDHQLLEGSQRFSEHCRAFAETRALDIDCVAVDVERIAELGPEAAAREARYAALERYLEPGDWLLSAQHRDDQAETLLLNLLRGSGPLGIAAMPALRRFAGGWLARPLLDVPRAALLAYAAEHDLDWIDDPSNDDSTFDRNFLRNDVLPSLARRWPDVAARLAKSAALAGDAVELLDDLADIDLDAVASAPGRLSLTALGRLSPGRQANAIRRAARLLGLQPPGMVAIVEIFESLITAREDASPLVEWPGAEARRFRDHLFLLPPSAAPLATGAWTGEVFELGPGLGRLTLEPGRGLEPALVAAGLRVAARQGGEVIQTETQGPTRKLKKLLHEKAVLPWMRERVPLVYAGEQLVAVGDLWTAADATVDAGVRIAWQDRPTLT